MCVYCQVEICVAYTSLRLMTSSSEVSRSSLLRTLLLMTCWAFELYSRKLHFLEGVKELLLWLIPYVILNKDWLYVFAILIKLANNKWITCSSAVFFPLLLRSPSRQALMQGKQEFCHWDQTFPSLWLRLTLSSMASTPKGLRKPGIRISYWNFSAWFGKKSYSASSMRL